MKSSFRRRVLPAFAVVGSIIFPALRAQVVAPAEEKAPVQLSPFQVTMDNHVGYAAANALSGSRCRRS